MSLTLETNKRFAYILSDDDDCVGDFEYGGTVHTRRKGIETAKFPHTSCQQGNALAYEEDTTMKVGGTEQLEQLFDKRKSEDKNIRDSETPNIYLRNLSKQSSSTL